MEPDYGPGDLIIVQVVNEDTELNVGDDITFTSSEDLNGDGVENDTITHRIIEIQESDGFTFYTTHGINEQIAVEQTQTVIRSEVIAKHTGIVLSGFGSVYDFLTSQMGFFLVILLPLIIFFIYEVIRVIRNLIAYNKEKAYDEAMANASNNSGLSEEEMKLAVEKYLAEQAKQTNNNEEQSALSDETDNANTNNTEE